MSKRNNPTLQKQALAIIDQVAEATHRYPSAVRLGAGVKLENGKPVLRWKVTVEFDTVRGDNKKGRAAGEGYTLAEAALGCIAHEKRCVDTRWALPGKRGAA